MKKIIALVGPTASGKTGIGVRLAKALNGEIVSADSRQVYRGLNIGTGKEYFDDVKQWMIDIVEPGERFSLFDYLPLARLAIEDIFSRGKVPIIVGGTGLYVQAILEGFRLEGITDYGLRIKNNNRERLNNLTIEQLNDLLSELDPIAYGKVDKNNPRRLIRAIERAQEGLNPTKIKPDFETLQIGIDLPREALYKKIDDRVEQRFSVGMLEEIIGLILSRVDVDWLIKLGLEYRIITEFILNNLDSPILRSETNDKIQMPNFEQKPKGQNVKISDIQSFKNLFDIRNLDFDIDRAAKELRMMPEYENMKTILKHKIHAFARRQLTWFRRFPEIVWLSDYNQIEKAARDFLSEDPS